MVVFLVVGAGVSLAVVLIVILTMHFSARIARITVVASALTIVITTLWMLWTAAVTLSGDRLTVTVPVTPMPPRLDKGVTLEHSQATILSGGLDQATVQVTGLSLPTRLTLLISVLVAGATMIGVSLVIRKLARSLDKGDPFALGGRALMATALIVLVGGLFASVIGDLGSWRASAEIFEINAWAGTDPASTGDVASFVAMGWPSPSELRVNLPFWPLGAGLVLALLAGVFRHGQQLRKDAEGLV